MPTPKVLTPAMAKRKFERKQELRAMAKDMGISVHKLARELSIDREIGLANKESRRITGNESNENSRQRMVDRVAEKVFIGTNSEKAFGYAREWSELQRRSANSDPAVIAARKIFRAIPAGKDAIVITRKGWEVVQIARPEKALNQKAIERQLAKVEKVANSAIEKANSAKELADAKTVLKRTPKALKDNAEKLAGYADTEMAKLRKVQSQLRKAKKQHSASNLVIAPVKDIRISLRPQSMANSVARAMKDIPERQDVHPFPSQIRIRDHRQFSPHSYESQPERDYRRYVEMMERIAELEQEREIQAERRERYFREMAEKAMAEFWEQHEKQERERKEKAKARMANNRANWSPERKAIERMRNKESQRRAKLKKGK
jgi:hypothetical protein